MQEKKKGMPTWAKIVLGLLAISIIMNLVTSKSSTPLADESNVSADTATVEAESTPVVSNYEKALSEIRKEKQVLEAIITEANVLYASVKDDGTRRDGYAEYLCQVLSNQGVKDIRVKIVKHNSTKDPKRDNAYGVLLGESYCKF